MEEFKVGDVVQLKSGGPKMTIKRLIGQGTDNWQSRINEEAMKAIGHKNGDLVCVWFENNQLKDAVFPPETVEKP